MVGHNPGGVFNNWRGQSYTVPSYPRRDPYEYSYARPPKPPKRKPRKREIVSTAIWCDAGEHAFSSNDPDRHRFSETKMEKDPEYGGQREVTTTVDVCGPCWKSNNPFQQSKEKAALRTDEKPSYAEGGQDESYLRGYRDGVVKGETIQ